MKSDRPAKENQDVNDRPISPPAPENAQSVLRRDVMAHRDEYARQGDSKDKSSRPEAKVDTDANPSARPPGPPDQDESPVDAHRHVDNENGGPTPTLGE